MGNGRRRADVLVLAALVPSVAYGEPSYVEPRLRAELGAIVGFPRGNWNAIDTKTSGGLHAQVGVGIVAHVSAIAGFRLIVPRLDSEFHYQHRELQLGVRATAAAGTARLFAEGTLQRTTRAVDSDEYDPEDETHFGWGARFGAMWPVASHVGVGGAFAYSRMSYEAVDEVAPISDTWISLDLFVSYSY